MPIDALSVSCAQLTRDLLAIAKFLFSSSRAQLKPMHRFLRWMAHTQQRDCAQGRSFWGSGRWVTSYGESMPQKLPRKGRSFKPKRQNLYIAISPELLIRRTSGLRTAFRLWKALRGWSAITPKSKYNMADVILKIDTSSYFRSGWSDLYEWAPWCSITRRLQRNGPDRNQK